MNRLRCLFLLVIIGLSGCDILFLPVDSNLIFPNTIEIQVGGPLRDETVSPTPGFSWASAGADFAFVGIFTDRIEINSRKHFVTNPAECVWAWYSGFGTGRQGLIAFGDGRNVRDCLPLEAEMPTPLTSGTRYYWAVWAWNKTGDIITHSSQEMYFDVE